MVAIPCRFDPDPRYILTYYEIKKTKIYLLLYTLEATAMNNTEIATVSQVLKQLIASSPHKHKLEEATILCAWKQVMPLVVLKRTEQAFVKQDKLFIKISSAPLRQELQNTKDQVLQLIRKAAPDCTITDIVLL